LTLATLGGHKNIISDLLARNSVDIDHPDLDNRTLLSYAADLGYVDMARFLVASGANINSEDIRKRTGSSPDAFFGSTLDHSRRAQRIPYTLIAVFLLAKYRS
jgi:ankyrin repeat protein